MVSAKCLAQKPGAKEISTTKENAVDTLVALWSAMKTDGRSVDFSGESEKWHFSSGKSLAPEQLIHLWELSTESGCLVDPSALEKAGPLRPPLPAEGGSAPRLWLDEMHLVTGTHLFVGISASHIRKIFFKNHA